MQPAEKRASALDIMKRAWRVLRASMKLTRRCWAKSDRLKHSTDPQIYEVRLRADHRGVDLISDVLAFSPLWYAGPNAISNAIKYAKFSSRSHDAEIRIYDEAGNVIEAQAQGGDLFKPRVSASVSQAAPISVAANSATAEEMTTAPTLGGLHGLVWVNTRTHVYHKEGSRFYGTTKMGEYMTELEAIQMGNKAAARKSDRAKINAALI
jgi:hypothetical protein